MLNIQVFQGVEVEAVFCLINDFALRIAFKHG